MLTVQLYSQMEDANWLMGGVIEPDSLNSTTVLDFNTSPPSLSLEYEFIGFYLTNSNISDSEGNLLLYSNGVNVYDSNHEVIDNGNDLQSTTSYPLGYSYNQSSIFFSYPENPTKYIYFLFDRLNVEFNGTPNGAGSPLTYSIIDLNGGNAVVTEKKALLSTDTSHLGELTGVLHANGRDWWLLAAPTYGSNRFLKFLLTPEGIGLHDKQEVGSNFNPGLGQGAISPDGEWVAYYNWFGHIPDDSNIGIDLYRFDRCSGQLNDHVQMIYEDEGTFGGAAFSPNGRFLYVSASFFLYQFDLWADDIPASRITVAEWDGFLDEHGRTTRFFLMKLAPDNKIYISSTANGSRYMSRIEQPDSLGTACDVQQHSIFLPTYNLWSIPHHPVYRLGAIEGSPCDTIPLVSVSENLLEAGYGWQMFPNPATASVQLQLNLPNGKTALWQLFNRLGQEVASVALTGQAQTVVPLNGLPSGFYFYRLTIDGQLAKGGKLVVQPSGN